MLTVLLPSVCLGLLALRAFQGEELRLLYQRKERQQQIVRLVENDLSSWLLSLRTDSTASESFLKLQIENDRIVLPDLNVEILNHRPSERLLSLSNEESRLWSEAQAVERSGPASAVLE
ncbi:hypothetical protein MYX65_07935 [Acidobacteria bacterium AH-259-L09]|nr:hypothetical protein [Acidobacteria bacterium AH-259-L09]